MSISANWTQDFVSLAKVLAPPAFRFRGRLLVWIVAAITVATILIQLQNLVGLWTTLAWAVAVLLLETATRRLARAAGHSQASLLAIFQFGAVYCVAATVFGSVSVPLWLHVQGFGDLAATGILLVGILRAVFNHRGGRAAFLGAVPVGALFFLAPFYAAGLGRARIDSPIYWSMVTVILVGGFAWARELDRMDRLNAQAIDDESRRRRQAESATAAKSAFIAMISHELRTPINGVLAASADLERMADPIVRDRGSLIAGAARMMRTLLNDLLDQAKIEAGQMTIEHVPFELDDLLRDTVKLYRLDAERKGLKLVLTGDENIPGQIVGDPNRIRQILNNLLSNALKFTERGQVTLSVESQAAESGGWLMRLSVTDTGAGIDGENLGRLFTPFAQADASIARTHGGTGLGLSISRDLARLMGGDVEVRSLLGEGSTFTATIVVDEAVGLPAALAVEAEDHASLVGLRVFAADDHEINRRVLVLLLEPLGVVLDLAADGEEALRRLMTTPFDVVLMDVQMPHLDGLEGTHPVRAA